MKERRGEWLSAQTVGITLAIAAIVVILAGHFEVYGTFNFRQLFRDMYANAGSEMWGIAITVLVIDKLNERRHQRMEERREREELIHQLGSTIHDIATRAAEELRAHGWLQDGALRAARLEYANLQGVSLVAANLEKTDLSGSNLQGADLRNAHLQGATLGQAHLQGADLRNANLLMAQQVETGKYDTTTLLPDGSAWAHEMDVRRFTDPQHPDFWRPAEPASPTS